jgi:hypothetical protein
MKIIDKVALYLLPAFPFSATPTTNAIVQGSDLQFTGIMLIYIRYIIPAPALKAVCGHTNNSEKGTQLLHQLKQKQS